MRNKNGKAFEETGGKFGLGERNDCLKVTPVCHEQ